MNRQEEPKDGTRGQDKDALPETRGKLRALGVPEQNKNSHDQYTGHPKSGQNRLVFSPSPPPPLQRKLNRAHSKMVLLVSDVGKPKPF